MNAGPCGTKYQVYILYDLRTTSGGGGYLFFELLDAAWLDLVDQFAENHSVLENLSEVASRKGLAQHGLHPLKMKLLKS